MIAAFEAGLRAGPDYPYALAGLANLVADKKHKLRAVALARAAIAAGGDDARTLRRARAVLHALIPGYHVPMMNDARRNLAWDKALRRAVRPGMQVLEIGTGAGMLAMMAARAGAARVVTCEKDEVAAALARELAARNGYGDRIVVVGKRSQDLRLGVDLERPADLLFCDIFADNLFNFDPLSAIADVKARLLAPGAPIVPAAASLQVALGHWRSYDRIGHIDHAAGFDLSPMADFAAAKQSLEVGDPNIALVAAPEQGLRFVFAAASPSLQGDGEVVCTAPADAEANGIVYWIRLELDDETVLEARPEPGAVFFSRMVFQPLRAPRRLRAGEKIPIALRYFGNEFEAWIAA
ncbi:MAG: 50S ribosomal protein L11 methyltransferase [Rhizomicrobium sp.]